LSMLASHASTIPRVSDSTSASISVMVCPSDSYKWVCNDWQGLIGFDTTTAPLRTLPQNQFGPRPPPPGVDIPSQLPPVRTLANYRVL
jgi:hypothetical protein